jgi:subtilisin family serine protease
MAWTGRYLITGRGNFIAQLSNVLDLASIPPFETAVTPLSGDFRLDNIGVIVTRLTATQLALLQLLVSNDGPLVAIEREPTLRRLGRTVWTDTAGATWGLDAVGATASPYDGTGTTVVVLDSGCDATHPLFDARNVRYHSIIGDKYYPAGEDIADHGTSCVAIAAGGMDTNGMRIGVATGATVWMGRIEKGGEDVPAATLEAGIDWAIGKGVNATVISISYGNDEEEPLAAFTQAGERALAAGCLVVAAAGNSGPSGAVGQPANSPSIRAIGAIDKRGMTWTNTSVSGSEAAVDAAAPGAEIHAAVAGKKRYGWFNGTSAAAPHAAGVVALWADASTKRGDALWMELAGAFEGLPNANADAIGGGLIKAPPGTQVLITVADEADLMEVTRAVTAAGARTVRALANVRVLSASVRPEHVASLAGITGVLTVETPKPVRQLRR